MAEMNLAGRVALVTGASRGIGRGIAIGLAEAGADVAVNYTRGEEAAAETVAAIEALGRKAKAYQASVTDEAAGWRQFGVNGLPADAALWQALSLRSEPRLP